MKVLSVVVPLYNQEKYIRQCIESIMNQSYYDINIIIIDDGSTDKSNEICKELAQSDDRITIIEKENGGVLSAIREGVAACVTQYVTFVDADDFILPDAYIYASESMQKDIDMIMFEATRYYSAGMTKREPHIIETGYYDKKRIKSLIFPKLIWDFSRNTPGIECALWSRIMKTNHIKGILEKGVGNRKFHYGDDVALTYPMYLKVNDIQVIGESFYMHRQRNGDIAPYIKKESFFTEVFDLYCCLLESFQDSDQYDIFKKQIEYFYMYSVNLRKMKYNDYYYSREFLFPFEKVPMGSNIVLYGAGAVGSTYYKQLEKSGYCQNVIWVDKNAEALRNERIESIDCVDNNICDYVVIAIENKNICHSVREWLLQKGIAENKIIY